LTRGAPDRAAADGVIDQFLQQRPDRNGPDSDLLRIEYRREIFQHLDECNSCCAELKRRTADDGLWNDARTFPVSLVSGSQSVATCASLRIVSDE
jgi:hypothetical protein